MIKTRLEEFKNKARRAEVLKILKYNGFEVEETPTTLEKFKSWEFSSERTTGEDFKVFAEKFEGYIKRNLPSNSKLIKLNAAHYYLSGFIKKENKFVYFSIFDVRGLPGDWANKILIRTAEDERDFNGGTNHYTALEEFSLNIEKLF